jgi:hypothetical protein
MLYSSSHHQPTVAAGLRLIRSSEALTRSSESTLNYFGLTAWMGVLRMTVGAVSQAATAGDRLAPSHARSG